MVYGEAGADEFGNGLYIVVICRLATGAAGDGEDVFCGAHGWVL